MQNAVIYTNFQRFHLIHLRCCYFWTVFEELHISMRALSMKTVEVLSTPSWFATVSVTREMVTFMLFDGEEAVHRLVHEHNDGQMLKTELLHIYICTSMRQVGLMTYLQHSLGSPQSKEILEPLGTKRT